MYANSEQQAELEVLRGGNMNVIENGVVIKPVTPVKEPIIYNITMTTVDTEYSQALPANTKKFLIHTRDGTTFRLAFVTGKVATPTEPYFTIPANQSYYEDYVDVIDKTLYFGCGDAGKIIEIIAWT